MLCSEMESSVYFTLGWMGFRSSPSPFLLSFFFKTHSEVLEWLLKEIIAAAITALCVKRLQSSAASLLRVGGHLDIKMPPSCICRQAATNHLLRQRGTHPGSSAHQSLPLGGVDARWWFLRQGQQRTRNKEVEKGLARGQHRKSHLLIFSARGENRPAARHPGGPIFS